MLQHRTKDDERKRIERHFSRRLQVIMVAEGALVGLVVGVIVTIYRMGLSRAEELVRSIVPSLAGNPAALLRWSVGLVCAAFLVILLLRFEPDTRGSGIPQVDAEVMGKLDMRWLRVILTKLVEGILCTASGLSLGREGPSVQLGGMAGKGVSRMLVKGRGEEHVLVTCGAAAGMAAAFHAPLTGVLFALEEIHREFNAPLVITAMASTATSDFVASHVLGIEPVLHFDVVDALPHADYGFVVLMGLLCGLVGALHNKGMFVLQDHLFARLRTFVGDGVIVVPFLISGIMALHNPQLLCGGDAILGFLETHAHLSASVLVSLLIGKYLFTALCFASGAPGGTLLPLVIMGSLFGALCGLGAMNAGDVPLAYLNNFILLGVAGMFSGSVRAPVTAVVLCFELCGSLEALLSVTAVSIIAFVTANLLNIDPFYEHLLDALLVKLPDSVPAGEGNAQDKVLHSHVVGTGSVAERALVSSLPWPKGVLLVTVERAGTKIIPKGDTRLEALDELLFIMDAESEAESEQTLQDLCGGRS